MIHRPARLTPPTVTDCSFLIVGSLRRLTCTRSAVTMPPLASIDDKVSPSPSSNRLRSWSPSQRATNERTKNEEDELGRNSIVPLKLRRSRAVTVTLFFTLVGYDSVCPFIVIGGQLSSKRPGRGVFRFGKDTPANQPSLLQAVFRASVVSRAYGTSFVSTGPLEEIVSVPLRDEMRAVNGFSKSNGCLVVRLS